MHICVVYVNTPGLRHDALVIRNIIKNNFVSTKYEIELVTVPDVAEGWSGDGWLREDVERSLYIEKAPQCVIFLENIIDHSILLMAKIRILIPNPEQLNNNIQKLIPKCNFVLHKSHLSYLRLHDIFPMCHHIYTGFTSLDPFYRIKTFNNFIHAKGGRFTQRNTQMIIDCWKKHPEWQRLTILSHDEDFKENDCNYNCGDSNNIVLINGWLSKSDYFELLAESGLHLCTSSHEGFGHYLNESRAMGAVVITLNAPPMNELVDYSSGILVEFCTEQDCQLGISYSIDPKSIESNIIHIHNMNIFDKVRISENARRRYVEEYERFCINFMNFMTSHLENIS